MLVIFFVVNNNSLRQKIGPRFMQMSDCEIILAAEVCGTSSPWRQCPSRSFFTLGTGLPNGCFNVTVQCLVGKTTAIEQCYTF
jgi:hypothetical protein